MVIDQMQTTVGYFCPVCGTGVISMVGAFQLNGDMMRLKCPCHNSALTITMAHGGEQDHFGIAVFCLSRYTPLSNPS